MPQIIRRKEPLQPSEPSHLPTTSANRVGVPRLRGSHPKSPRRSVILPPLPDVPDKMPGTQHRSTFFIHAPPEACSRRAACTSPIYPTTPSPGSSKPGDRTLPACCLSASCGRLRPAAPVHLLLAHRLRSSVLPPSLRPVALQQIPDRLLIPTSQGLPPLDDPRRGPRVSPPRGIELTDHVRRILGKRPFRKPLLLSMTQALNALPRPSRITHASGVTAPMRCFMNQQAAQAVHAPLGMRLEVQLQQVHDASSKRPLIVAAREYRRIDDPPYLTLDPSIATGIAPLDKLQRLPDP
jgi:hypothetical protein